MTEPQSNDTKRQHATCYYYTGQAVAGYTQREAGPIPGKRTRARKIYELPIQEPEPGASEIRVRAFLEAKRLQKQYAAPERQKGPPEPRTYRPSPHTRRRCRRAIAALLYAAQKANDRVYMYTITFADHWQVSHTEAKHVWEVYTRRLVHYVRTSTGVEPPLVRVSELQGNGTIHFHTLIACPERLPFNYLLKGQAQVLTRCIPRLQGLADSYAGIWFTHMKHKGGGVGRYVGKMTGKLTSYLSKQTDVEFGCAVWSSNQAAKSLPVGFASYEPEAVLYNPFKVSAYLTVYDYGLGWLFGEFAEPPNVSKLAETVP